LAGGRRKETSRLPDIHRFRAGRTPQQCRHRVLGILARARILKNFLGQNRQSHHFIHLSEKQQTAITGYFGAMEFQLHTGIKLDPQDLFFALTHQVSPFFCFNIAISLYSSAFSANIITSFDFYLGNMG
jgi:hypothetical protein